MPRRNQEKIEISSMDVNSLEISELKEVIREHPHRIKELREQSEDICKIAVGSNPNVLCLVRNQTEEICL